MKKGRIVKILDGIKDLTKRYRYMFFMFAMVIVFVKFLWPKLTWSRWIIGPLFILWMIGWLWSSVRDDIVDGSKSKEI